MQISDDLFTNIEVFLSNGKAVFLGLVGQFGSVLFEMVGPSGEIGPDIEGFGPYGPCFSLFNSS